MVLKILKAKSAKRGIAVRKRHKCRHDVRFPKENRESGFILVSSGAQNTVPIKIKSSPLFTVSVVFGASGENPSGPRREINRTLTGIGRGPKGPTGALVVMRANHACPNGPAGVAIVPRELSGKIPTGSQRYRKGLDFVVEC